MEVVLIDPFVVPEAISGIAWRLLPSPPCWVWSAFTSES
jgi:hypothetical protein